MFEIDAIPQMYPVAYIYTNKNFFTFQVRVCDDDVGLALSNDIGVTDQDTYLLYIGQTT